MNDTTAHMPEGIFFFIAFAVFAIITIVGISLLCRVYDHVNPRPRPPIRCGQLRRCGKMVYKQPLGCTNPIGAWFLLEDGCVHYRCRLHRIVKLQLPHCEVDEATATSIQKMNRRQARRAYKVISILES